jgi:hypothetical protein
MTIRTVLILLHRNDHGFQNIHYLVKPLIAAWQAEGLRVDVARGGARLPAADVLFPHLDLTLTPPAYRRLFARYPLVVNRTLTDISKRRISTNLLGPGDNYDGPVIVKTDRNYGGLPEQRLLPEPHWVGLLRNLPSRLARRSAGATTDSIDWSRVQALEPGRYPVYASLGAVPREVFANRRLVVEKFIPEHDEQGYAIRYYYFLGRARVCYLLRSTEPATKFANAHTIERVAAPESLDLYRRQRGIDFGKIDFVMRNGAPTIIDVNRTPALQPGARLAGEIVKALAAGLQSLAEAD